MLHDTEGYSETTKVCSRLEVRLQEFITSYCLSTSVPLTFALILFFHLVTFSVSQVISSLRTSSSKRFDFSSLTCVLRAPLTSSSFSTSQHLHAFHMPRLSHPPWMLLIVYIRSTRSTYLILHEHLSSLTRVLHAPLISSSHLISQRSHAFYMFRSSYPSGFFYFYPAFTTL